LQYDYAKLKAASLAPGERKQVGLLAALPRGFLLHKGGHAPPEGGGGGSGGSPPA
jgi:hypothetical protein